MTEEKKKPAAEMVDCSLCGARVPLSDVCSTLACRGCHKSISFDECVSGSYVRRLRREVGLP